MKLYYNQRDENSINVFLTSGKVRNATLIKSKQDVTKLQEQFSFEYEEMTEGDIKLALDGLPNRLTPRQFAWMIARYEYDDVIDHVLVAAKQSGQREIYAKFFMDIKAANSFGQYETIEAFSIAKQFQMTPEDFELNTQELMLHWKEAEQV